MSDYIRLNFDVFDETGQEASVLNTLTVAELIDEITREFEDLDRETPESYALYAKAGEAQLERSQPLVMQGIRPGDHLLFGWARGRAQWRRQPIESNYQAFLREEGRGEHFPIAWQPAIIGRPDAVDPAQAELLAVNLEDLPDSRRISRRHAQITGQDGDYYLESLASNNPTFLNGEPLAVAQKRRLRTGDTIELGRVRVPLTFILQQEKD